MADVTVPVSTVTSGRALGSSTFLNIPSPTSLSDLERVVTPPFYSFYPKAEIFKAPIKPLHQNCASARGAGRAQAGLSCDPDVLVETAMEWAGGFAPKPRAPHAQAEPLVLLSVFVLPPQS